MILTFIYISLKIENILWQMLSRHTFPEWDYTRITSACTMDGCSPFTQAHFSA